MDEEIGVTGKDRLILGKMILNKDFNSRAQLLSNTETG